MGFHWWELLPLLLIGILIFGPKKLPELGKGIGEGFKALKEDMKDKPTEQASTPNPTATPTSNNPDVKS